MVGTPSSGISQTTLALLKDRAIGGIFLSGRSTAGVAAIAKQTAQYRKAATTPGTLLIATDQEGGNVQVLRGSGFSTIPSAVKQAANKTLVKSATAWGTELAKAGVNVNLAPVADLVDKIPAAQNKPIGYYGRNYGKTEASVEFGATDFAEGMQKAGVIPTLKHFPGLGRVYGNTDVTANVTDKYTLAGGTSIKVFKDIVAELEFEHIQPWVMMSLAVYPNIDKTNPAAFSPKIVSILRDSGFDGVIITDDLASAKQVAGYTPADRAIKAISAGVDIVLFSGTSKNVPAAMDAVLAKAQKDPVFAARVTESARRVALAQASLGAK